jgi:mRNA interferase RelE/StbE
LEEPLGAVARRNVVVGFGVQPMPFEVVYHPDVKKIDLPKLDERSKAMIKRAIEERLTTRPELFGRPLKSSLKSYWKLRVRGYRVVFKLFENKILVLAIIDRKLVYRQSTRCIEK